MGKVEVNWQQQKLRGGALLERWHAHLVKPFESLEFAWLLRQGGVWHLEIMLGDSGIREVAIYTCRLPFHPMRHVERWIAARDRWERLVLAKDAEDPRGKFQRFPPSASKHRHSLQLREFRRGKPCPFGGLE